MRQRRARSSVHSKHLRGQANLLLANGAVSQCHYGLETALREITGAKSCSVLRAAPALPAYQTRQPDGPECVKGGVETSLGSAGVGACATDWGLGVADGFGYGYCAASLGYVVDSDYFGSVQDGYGYGGYGALQAVSYGFHVS